MSNTTSTSLTVSVPAHVDDFIKDRIASGRFDTASDVVREAITLLEQQERMRDKVIDEIRRDIEEGARQADAGLLRNGHQVFEEIRQQRK